MAPCDGQVVTFDTNIAVYALSDEPKGIRAREILLTANFISVQVLNEYVSVARRKLGRDWERVANDLTLLRKSTGIVRPVEEKDNGVAVRIAQRYRLAFYDCVMIAVGLANGATALYSEDMQHGLLIDGTLTILNPFLSTDPQ